MKGEGEEECERWPGVCVVWLRVYVYVDSDVCIWIG